jgi:[protein-PII] uridylyltransferase
MKINARLLDDYLLEKFEQSRVGPRMDISRNPYAIVALGGYGREEQCIHSDVDLLFLFDRAIPSEAEDLIHEVIYPLWDAGLEVGHATRTRKECRSLAGKDFEVLTSLLDARFICGVSLLYADLLDQIRKNIISRRSDKIIAWLVEKNRVRHHQYGDSTYLLEPNLKNSQGGLRDYHTMLWIARIRDNIKQIRDLEYFGYLSHEEYRDLREALSFIWDVRNRLHHLTGRHCDQLHFEYQTSLATRMNFLTAEGQQPVELFLQKLHSRMEFIKQHHLMFLHELGYTEGKIRKRRPLKKTKVPGLGIIDNTLCFASPEAILKNSELLIHIFEESARKEIPLSTEAKRLVREFNHLVDADFINRSTVVKSFERILNAQTPVLPVLDEMRTAGFLTRFIPEFEGIVNRIQYDEYHIYPVDIHSLQTVQIIKDFATETGGVKYPFCSELYQTLPNRKLLLWAALLHDIGKGRPEKGHALEGERLVRDILSGKFKRKKDIETIAFLVREHLMLIEIATRRDINDEETAIYCARRIKDAERLKMLYLLTVADSLSTGPKAWSEWTSTLLRELFLKVLNILEKGELASREAMETVHRKEEMLLDHAGSSGDAPEMKNLIAMMSPRYLLYMPAEDILEHIKLYKDLGDSDFVWKVTTTGESNTRSVTICAKDRPGLISKIAGVFTLNNLNIMDVQVYTWRNNIALDRFEVTPPPDLIFEEERWERTRQQLRSALSGDMDLAGAVREKIETYRPTRPKISIQPSRINLDNDSSSFFTIIEVFTYDFPGLLFSITDALFRCKLNIWMAKIGTKIDQVVDVFYVRDFDGQKIDSPDHIAAIEKAVGEVVKEQV